MSAPFWDRRGPLDALERAAAAAMRVVVTGPRGIGKSALAARWAERWAREGRGRVLQISPPSPAADPAAVEAHLDAGVRRQAGTAPVQGLGWREAAAALLRDRGAGALLLDGLECYRHCLGSARYDEFIGDLESLPGVVVATGVPASAVPLSPAHWVEVPLSPLEDEVVADLLDRLWRAQGAALGEEARELLLHLIGGSPLALSAWAGSVEGAGPLDALDRASILSMHAGLLGDGMVGRWWRRCWETLFPAPAGRAAACSLAASLLAGEPTMPLAPGDALALETAGILVPSVAGSRPIVDPLALSVFRLAASREGTRSAGEINFLEEEVRAWERDRALARPRAWVRGIRELLRSWNGVVVGPAIVGAEGPIPPLPAMLAIAECAMPAPGDLPFLLLSGIAAEGPLGMRWRVAVATGEAPLAAAEISALADAVAHESRARGGGREHLLVVAPAGCTGGARTEASRLGVWHVDIGGLNALRAASGLPALAAPATLAGRLPRAGIEGEVVELTLPPSADAELIAAAAADQVAQMAGFGKEDRDRIRMAVVEGAINALEHGGGRVTVRLEVTAEGIRVTVRDFGPGITGLPAESSAAQRSSRRGWGTAVMKQLMDEVRIEPVAEGAKIVLLKRRPGERG